VATLVEVVALNALSVSRWVRLGRPSRPRVVRVGEFPGVEASRRASLVRVGTWSRASRLHMRVAQIDVSMWEEPQLDLSLGGSQSTDSLGVYSF
jgi:hypothetical protein